MIININIIKYILSVNSSCILTVIFSINAVRFIIYVCPYVHPYVRPLSSGRLELPAVTLILEVDHKPFFKNMFSFGMYSLEEEKTPNINPNIDSLKFLHQLSYHHVF